MPTALLENCFRFYFYSNENVEPKHVHVEKGSGFGKIWLEPIVQPAYFCNFTPREERMIMETVKNHIETIIEKWNEYFD